MYELIQVGERTYYIDCPSKIGIYKIDEERVCLIDSGNDKDAGKKVWKILEANGWKLDRILNTHSHADHIGGNNFLQQKSGCKIYCAGTDRVFVENTLLEPSFLYGGSPYKELKNKFLCARPSVAEELTDAGLPEGMGMLRIDGHSFSMAAFCTEDGIWFVADGVTVERIMEKYHVTFLYDVGEYLDSLDKLEKLEGRLFIPSHGETVTELKTLVVKNREKVYEIRDMLKEVCAVPVGNEDILKAVFDRYQLAMDGNQYVLVGSTVRSYLAWMKGNGELERVFVDNRLVWKCKEDAAKDEAVKGINTGKTGSGIESRGITGSGTGNNGITDSRKEDRGTAVGAIENRRTTVGGIEGNGIENRGKEDSAIIGNGMADGRITGSGIADSRITGSGMTDSGMTSRMTGNEKTDSRTTGNGVIYVNEDRNGILKGMECFALDMDGTIYLGEQWIDGAKEFLAHIEAAGKNYVFLTNNSSKNPGVYVEKLRRMGLDAGLDKIVTSGQAAIHYLKKHYGGKKVFLLGNPMLQEEFAEEGICLEEENPDVVVTAFDTSLDYGKMCKVCDFVRSGLPYIATHPDYNCPTETGFIPDAGAIHAFIYASAGRYPDRIIGKPNGDIIDYLLERTGAERGRTVMVGDRLYTDVAAGVGNGLKSVLVLSGEAALEDVGQSGIQPDLVFDSVKEMGEFL